MSIPDPILEVKDLKVHFPVEKGLLFKRRIGLIKAVDGISFHIGEGETLGLVGESGCGKSTTARALALLERPTGGQVIFNRLDLSRSSKAEVIKARMGLQMVFQDPYASLNPRMKARQIIAEPLVIYTKRRLLDLGPKDIDDRLEELMDLVGLSKTFRDRYPHEFSGGQRQRLGIARALALNPKMILADEPVSALDVSIQSQIINLLQDLQKDLGLTYLFISHDLAVVKYISSRIAVMYLGRIVETADSDSLCASPLHPYTQALLSAIPMPDPKTERNRHRILLQGDVLSPDQLGRGCCFKDRCPRKKKECEISQPPLISVAEGRQVACFAVG